MSYMTEKELRSELDCAQEGTKGFLTLSSALARFFNSCEYRNVYTISYNIVQWSFEELASGPKDFKGSDKKRNVSFYKKSEINKSYLPSLVELIRALLKWAEDEEIYQYDVTNDLIEPVIDTIKKRFLAKKDLREICFDLFFAVDTSKKKDFVFNGDFFRYLSGATPNYDDLLDPNEITARSKKVAEDEYKNELSKIFESERFFHFPSPFEYTAKRIEEENKALKGGYGEVWNIASGIEYLDKIPMLLSFRTTYGYYEYYEEWDDAVADCEYPESDGVPAHNYVFLNIPEIKHQEKISKSLKEHILIGANVAQRIKSDTYTIWRNAYLSFLRRDYDACVAQIKEAEALIFADNVIKRYGIKNEVIESAPKKVSSTSDAYLIIYCNALKCLEDTEKVLSMIIRNEISKISPPITKRSELFQKSHISRIVGCFEMTFLEKLLFLDLHLRPRNMRIQMSIEEIMYKIKAIWENFLQRLLSVSCCVRGESIVIKAKNSLKEFYKVFERHYVLNVDDCELNIEVEEKGAAFISSIEDLSSLIDLLKDKSFEELGGESETSHVLVDGFTEEGKKQLKSVVRKPRKNKRSEFRTQEDVAKDTGFSRKTINKWEREQSSDDTNNKSNKYEYYESLRTDREKNGAYKIWVKMVVEYKKKKNTKKSFVSFKEEWWAHNPDAIRMLHLK